MANYYYFVPSLPSIRPDGGSYMTVDDFLALCRSHIGKDDYRTLVEVVKGDGLVKGNAFVEGYSRFRTMVEKELVWQRSRRLGKDRSEYHNDTPPTGAISAAVRKAVEDEDPLRAEKSLLDLHFDYLDRNVGPEHRWDLTALISYALKLQLLSRRDSFTVEKGKGEFTRLSEALRGEIFN